MLFVCNILKPLEACIFTLDISWLLLNVLSLVVYHVVCHPLSFNVVNQLIPSSPKSTRRGEVLLTENDRSLKRNMLMLCLMWGNDQFKKEKMV